MMLYLKRYVIVISLISICQLVLSLRQNIHLNLTSRSENPQIEKYNCREAFKNIRLKVHVPLTETESTLHLLDKRRILEDNAVKLNYPLMEALKFMFHFNVEYVIDYCNNSNDTDDNVDATMIDCTISKLLNESVDLSLMPLLMTREKIAIFDFPAVSKTVFSKFIFLQPKLSLITNVYTLPFEASVWIASIIFLIIVVLLLFVINKWQQYKNSLRSMPSMQEREIIQKKIKHFVSEAPENDTSNSPESLSDISFTVVSAVVQQGPEREPQGVHTKLITWCLFVSCMFLYSAYSANIVTLLQGTSTDIRNVADLAESGLNIGVHDSDLIKRVLLDAVGDDQIKILEKLGIKIGNSLDYTKFTYQSRGVSNVRQGMYAFYVEEFIGRQLIEHTFDEIEKCELLEVQFVESPINFYWAIKKKSLLFEMMKIGILRLREIGVHHRELSLFHIPKLKCWTLDKNFNSVGIIDCYYAIAFFAAGVVLSLGIFVAEIFAYKTNVKSWKYLQRT